MNTINEFSRIYSKDCDLKVVGHIVYMNLYKKNLSSDEYVYENTHISLIGSFIKKNEKDFKSVKISVSYFNKNTNTTPEVVSIDVLDSILYSDNESIKSSLNTLNKLQLFTSNLPKEFNNRTRSSQLVIVFNNNN